MRKQELVDDVWVKIHMESDKRAKLRLSKSQTATAVDAVFTALADALTNGQAIAIPGFGKFQIKQHAADSQVFSPWKKGKITRRPDRLRTVKFKPSSALVKQVNQPASSSA